MNAVIPNAADWTNPEGGSFATIVSFDQAQRILASVANALPSESIAISETLDRVLAEPLTAGLRIIGESRAGQAYAGTVGAAEAVRIFTGAPIPAAADRVIIQENIDRQDGEILIARDCGTSLHIRKTACDCQATPHRRWSRGGCFSSRCWPKWYPTRPLASDAARRHPCKREKPRNIFRARWDDAGLTPLINQESGSKLALKDADWLIRCPPDSPQIDVGAMVTALLF